MNLLTKLSIVCLLLFTLSSIQQPPVDEQTDINPEVVKFLERGESMAEKKDFEGALATFNEGYLKAKMLNDLRGMAACNIEIGFIFEEKNDFKKARDYHQIAHEYAVRAESKIIQAATLSHIAHTDEELGNYQSSLSFYRKSLEIWKLRNDNQNIARTHMNIGLVNRKLGLSDRAIVEYNSALNLFSSSNIRDKAIVHNNLAAAYEALGNYSKAFENYQLASKMHEKLRDPIQRAYILNNLGVLYNHTHDYDKALLQFEQAYAIFFRTNNKGLASVLHNKGNSYFRKNDFDKAIQLYQDALKIRQSIKDKDGQAITLSQLGLVHYHKCNLILDKSMVAPKKFFQSALDIYKELDNKKEIAQINNNLYLIHYVQGNYEKCIENLNEALRYAEETKDMALTATVLTNFAYLYENYNKIEEAEIACARAITIIENLRHTLINHTTSTIKYLDGKMGPYHLQQVIFLKKMKNTNMNQRVNQQVETMFLNAQLIKARALRDISTSNMTEILAKIDRDEAEQLKELARQCDIHNTEMLKLAARNVEGDRKLFEAKGEQLRTAQNSYEIFKDTLIARHSGNLQRKAPIGITINSLEKLPKDAVLLEYVYLSGLGDQTFPVLYVVHWNNHNKQQINLFPLQHDHKLLTQTIKSFYDTCSYPYQTFPQVPLSVDNITWKKHAKSLYRMLLEPAIEIIKNKKNLIISPDGPIWDISFSSMLAGTNTGDFQITYAFSSTTAISAIKSPVSKMKNTNGVVLANPFIANSNRFGTIQPGTRPFQGPDRPFQGPDRPFNAPIRFVSTMKVSEKSAEGLGVLPGAQLEGEFLKSFSNKFSTLNRSNAQESTFKKVASNAEHIHIAAHAFINEYAPMYSSIILADPKDKNKEDGYLTAQELSEIKLRAKMVVLSACSTARGETRRGEGVMGMSWSLASVGVPTQVISQWGVHDAATAELMKEFYANLKQGMPKGAALHKAIAKIRKKKEYEHPYFWAPFILTGDWR